jgi:hypothetical protein
MNPMSSLIVRDQNTNIVPVLQEGPYVEERALLEIENQENLQAHFENVAIHQIRDQTENSLRQIIRRQQEQLRLLMQEKALLATQVVTLEGRVKELKATHKAELRSLGIDRFEDVNELVTEIIDIMPSYADAIPCYASNSKAGSLWNIVTNLGAGNPPGEPLAKTLDERAPGWDKTSAEKRYNALLNSLYPKMRHFSSEALAEVLKMIHIAWGGSSATFTSWSEGWDVEIVTLTPETIQKIKNLHNT